MSDDEEQGKKALRLPKKAARVKNKEAAALQITAEQLLREAKEREVELLPPPPKNRISDPEELAEYQRKKRKEFEDGIRKNKHQLANWVKYGKWEESIGELQRSRSVFERALDVDHRSLTIWLQYAEMEMRNKQVNHARNIFDRAVTILPRAVQFWLKYSYMEEVVENIPGARQVFERWMEWEPQEQAWQTYINFELRYKEISRARSVYQRFLHVHGTNPHHWIKYARFEEKHGNPDNARAAYESGMEYFGENNMEEQLLIAFAQFEERQNEHERARVIYKYGLEHLPESCAGDIYKYYTLHEKKFGERSEIEEAIISKRKMQYEQQIARNSFDYDAWFDYLRLLENEESSREEVEECYERAIANIPPQEEKRYWKRYIYLWINYALYQELTVKDMDKTREGVAVGKCPKPKLYRSYIDLELQLREFDRCRTLYEKSLEFSPENSNIWIKFAELEALLGDYERARAIYDIAVNQTSLDMPEVVWKACIDFEINAEEFERARDLYDALLQRTNHIKVWISLAQFEQSIDRVDAARKVYERANVALENNDKEERLMLLEAWKDAEVAMGNEETLKRVESLFPRKIKRRRQIQTTDGVDAGWEEYFDYIFPADQSAKGANKLFAAALRWKQKKAHEGDGDAVMREEEEEEEKEREGDSDTDLGSDSEVSSTSSEDESD